MCHWLSMHSDALRGIGYFIYFTQSRALPPPPLPFSLSFSLCSPEWNWFSFHGENWICTIYCASLLSPWVKIAGWKWTITFRTFLILDLQASLPFNTLPTSGSLKKQSPWSQGKVSNWLLHYNTYRPALALAHAQSSRKIDGVNRLLTRDPN